MDVKVNALQMPNINDVVRTSDQKVEPDFKFTLLSKIDTSELKEKLSTMVHHITEQGNKIAKHTDIKDMKRYRELIKDFFYEVTTHSHHFSRENFLDRRGRHRVYGIIKKVDSNLDELAQELIKDEKNHMTILDKVDEIKGLILDIIT